MEGTRFAALTRQVAEAGSRRGALQVVAAAVAAVLLTDLRGEEAAAGIPVFGCKEPGKRCDKDKKCCSGHCRKRICSCVKKGGPCQQQFEGALCCSQRCHSGKCT
jgi:hypothetical protein